MANIRKSFNFRSGVQVDNDNFVVNANGLVGIGTSVPTAGYKLDVRGDVKSTGLTNTQDLNVTQNAEISGITTVGFITATTSYIGILTVSQIKIGNSETVDNLIGYARTTFITDNGGIGLYTTSKIGINTTTSPGASDSALEVFGDVNVTGIITATTFSGDVTGNVNSGISTFTELEVGTAITMSAGIITATTFDGDLIGNVTGNINASSGVSTFTELKVGTAITMSAGIITATTFDGDLIGDVTGNVNVTSGISTFNELEVGVASITNADVGIGTFNDLRIDKSSDASLVITSSTNSSVSIGESVSAGNSSAQLLYSPLTGRLDINNYDVGGVSVNLHEGTGTGTTESFNVNYNNSTKFEVTYDGKVGINKGNDTLEKALEVGGDISVTNNAVIAGILTVTGTAGNSVTLGDGSALPFPSNQNFNITSGISTFADFTVSNEITVSQDAVFNSSAYIFGPKVGIGTTNDSEFKTGPENLIMQATGSMWADNGFYTAGKVIITDKADGSAYTDDRIIPSSPIDYGAVVPYVSYGDFQANCGGASFIANNLMLVPSVGVATVGFGTTNGLLIPSSFLPGENRYLSKVGINTYYSRSLVDIGVGSTTMNSYVILPSLSQTDVTIVANLWNTPTGTGYTAARKVTPSGVPGGALLYNSTRDTIQVGHGTDSFRNLSPVVAFATINSGSLVGTDGYNIELSNSVNDANFTFSSALQSANYTVMVSSGSTTESYTVPESQKNTSGFRVSFSPSDASTQNYTVMILQV